MKKQDQNSSNNRDSKGRFVSGHRVNAYANSELKVLFDAYCAHIGSGLDKFSFELSDYRTLERYAGQTIMLIEELRRAKAKGKLFYEKMLIGCIIGERFKIDVDGEEIEIDPQRISAKSLIFIMKNKYPKTYENRIKQKGSLKVDMSNPQPMRVIMPKGGIEAHI